MPIYLLTEAVQVALRAGLPYVVAGVERAIYPHAPKMNPRGPARG
jgi:hypothetical protein